MLENHQHSCKLSGRPPQRKTQLVLATRGKIPHVCPCTHVCTRAWDRDEDCGGVEEEVRGMQVKRCDGKTVCVTRTADV